MLDPIIKRKLYLLTAIPIAFTGFYLVLDLVFFGTEYGKPIVSALNITRMALSCIGCFVAAWAFDRGEYLGRAWFFLGSCTAIFLLTFTVIKSFPIDTQSNAFFVVDGGISALANALKIYGLILFARTWSVIGLKLSGANVRKSITFIITMAMAMAATLPVIVDSFGQLLVGNLIVLRPLASSFADIICFSLIVPVLLIAVELRGGLLAWPWVFLTISQILWLFYDIVQLPYLLDIRLIDLFSIIIKCLASVTAFSAGLAQCFVIKQRVSIQGGYTRLNKNKQVQNDMD
jgi:hypothetical protein